MSPVAAVRRARPCVVFRGTRSPDRTRAVRIALTQTVLRWRDELAAAERHIADAAEAGAPFDVELYTDAAEELRAGINHLGDALAELEGM